MLIYTLRNITVTRRRYAEATQGIKIWAVTSIETANLQDDIEVYPIEIFQVPGRKFLWWAIH